MNRIPAKAALLLGSLLCASLASGCGASSKGAPIDVAGLQQELATVIHFEKLAQGFDFTVSVSCLSTASDGLQFACGVNAATPRRPTLSWTVMVTCQPPGATSAPRCASDTGDALQ